MSDSNRGLSDINMILSNWLLTSLELWEGRNIMNEDARNRIRNAKDGDVKEENRLKMDADEKYAPFLGHQHAVNECGPSCDTASPSLETLEQEKNRLTRELSIRLANNEAAICALRNVLSELEMRQKSMYYLRDTMNDSSRIQHNYVMELRRVLER